jgi:hypothetical protein
MTHHLTEPPESSKLGFWQIVSACYGTATDRKNSRRTTQFSIIWAASIIVATWVVKFLDLPAALVWVIALAPNLAALLTLSAYMKYLRMADELQRRIQLEGLAIGFGVGWFFAIGYLVAQAAGAPELPLTAMILVLTAGLVLGNVIAIRNYE